MRGTYRRDYEGDFLCTEAAVRAMFADQRDISVDSEILEDMGLDALNADTIKGYRIIFEQLHAGHPWNKLMKDEFLIKLKAEAKNKEGFVSPTVAGLLMFSQIIFWTTEKNVMTKMYDGCIGHIQMKVTGVEICLISFIK